MKESKFYKYNTTISWGIIMGVFLLGMLVPIILYPKEMWFLIFGMFLLLLSFWYLVGTGFFTPIYLFEEGIRYKGKTISWTEVKITAYPSLRKSYQYGYYLVFSDKFLYGKELKAEIKNGSWIFLQEKRLIEILKFYNSKIVVLGSKGENEERLRSTKQINSIINEHNLKH